MSDSNDRRSISVHFSYADAYRARFNKKMHIYFNIHFSYLIIQLSDLLNLTEQIYMSSDSTLSKHDQFGSLRIPVRENDVRATAATLFFLFQVQLFCFGLKLVRGLLFNISGLDNLCVAICQLTVLS